MEEETKALVVAVTAHNAFERTGGHRGRTVRACMCARAGVESGSCMAAQLDR